MARCTSCSAPLPPNSMICAYCGSRNDIDLTGISYTTTHAPDAPRSCPRCRIALRTIDIKLGGTFMIERCDRCLGLFFDPGELDAVLDATVTNVFEINRNLIDDINNARDTGTQGVSYVKCPVCERVMNRVNYGTRSGVIIDRCKDHGVWLDGGELRHLMEWVKAGGRLLDQERKEEREKEEAKRRAKEAEKAELRAQMARSAERGAYYDPASGSDENDILGALVKVISSIVR